MYNDMYREVDFGLQKERIVWKWDQSTWWEWLEAVKKQCGGPLVGENAAVSYKSCCERITENWASLFKEKKKKRKRNFAHFMSSLFGTTVIFWAFTKRSLFGYENSS